MTNVMAARSNRDDMLLALSPLLGITVALAVVMNSSFYGIATESVDWVAGIGCAVAIGYLLFRYAPRFSDCAPVGIIVLVVVVHFLWPILTTGRTIILVDAGDFNQYIGVSSWLVQHPIGEPAHSGSSSNTIQHNVLAHQNSKLRLGISMLLAFFASLGSKELVEVYSPAVALFLGLQAVSLYCFMRAGFPGLPRYLLTISCVLYGVSATATWPAYAAFVPQTLGMAFAVGIASLWVSIVRENRLVQPLSENRFLYGVLGVLVFGAWAVYPEAFPFVAVFCFLYAVIHYRSNLYRQELLSGLGKFLGIVFLVWFLVSPNCFLWGLQGLYVQLGSIPHGGEQVSSPYNLLLTATLSTQLPLVAGILESVPSGYRVAGAVGCALLIFGFGFLFIRDEGRNLAQAVMAASLLLFGFVLYKYSYSKYGYYPLWASLHTWNLFKAAQYVSPFVAAVSLGGVFSLASSLPTVWRRLLVAAVILVALILAQGQDRQVWSRSYTESFSEERISFLKGLPEEGQMLISLPNQEYATRYVVYSILRERSFISVSDWQPDELYRSAEEPASERSIFAERIAYILTDDRGELAGLPVVSQYDRYKLLSVPTSSILKFKVVGNGRPVVELESGPFGIRRVQ
jgi:hypothetical protein